MFRRSFALIPHAHFRSVAVGALALVLVSGCQGGNPPSETSTTTAAPASGSSAPGTHTPGPPASGTPTPSGAYKPADATGKAQNVPVPVMPAVAKENTKEGLEAFIRYWYATYSYATETGDVSIWMESTDTSTESGAAYKKAIEANYADGRWVTGGKIATPVIEVLWHETAAVQSAKVQVIQDEIHYFDSDGTSGQGPSPASNFAEGVLCTYSNGSWLVVENGIVVGNP